MHPFNPLSGLRGEGPHLPTIASLEVTQMKDSGLFPFEYGTSYSIQTFMRKRLRRLAKIINNGSGKAPLPEI
jgi:hypothetical protein